MATKTTKWDIQDHLTTPEEIAAYLEAVFEEDDPALIAAALGDVAQAKGVSKVARAAGVSRETIYSSFSEEGDPKLSTVLSVLAALGLRLTSVTAETQEAA